MDNLSPDFVNCWLGSDADAQPVSSGGVADEAGTAAQSDALQALAERVAAARSIL